MAGGDDERVKWWEKAFGPGPSLSAKLAAERSTISGSDPSAGPTLMRCSKCKLEYHPTTEGRCPQCGSGYATRSSTAASGYTVPAIEVISQPDQGRAPPTRPAPASFFVFAGSAIGSAVGGLIGWMIGGSVGGDIVTAGSLPFSDEGIRLGLRLSIILASVAALIGALIGYSYSRSQRERASIWLLVLVFVGGVIAAWGMVFLFIAFAASNS